MISKELLGEVLKRDINDIIYSPNENFIEYTEYDIKSDSGLWIDINIYELSHKCKLHFIKLGYEFDIQKDKVKISKRKDLPYYLTTITNTNQGDNFIPYDPYIDIKACQWILENA